MFALSSTIYSTGSPLRKISANKAGVVSTRYKTMGNLELARLTFLGRTHLFSDEESGWTISPASCYSVGFPYGVWCSQYRDTRMQQREN